MDRGLDPHMQRILNNAANYTKQNDHGQNFDYAPAMADRQSADWSFAPASRLLAQEPAPTASLNTFDRIPYQQPNSQLSQKSYQQPPRPNGNTSRLSLPPRNIYNQPVNVPQVLSNANNHFRFAQNLREGVPLSQPPPPRQSVMPSIDAAGQLTNSMVMQNPLYLPRTQRYLSHARPEDSEIDNLFSGHGHSKLGQLQPQRQQITPPLNLSGFQYSPDTRQSLSSSSPLAGHASSPTTRVSLRRSAGRAAPSAFRSTQAASHEDDVFTETRLTPREYEPKVAPPTERNYQRPSPIPSVHTPQARPTNQAGRIQALALAHAPPKAHGIQLVSPYELPDRFRHVFPYELFNAAQSKCFAPIYKTDDNVVVSAPTGSGKTAMLELAICRIVEGYQSGTFKIVYLAPIKSLCSERLRDWTKKFSHLNLPCAELTGDTNQGDMKKVRDASIIVTTPEKWDSITRKWTDHAKFVQMVKLFLIDEVHILKDPRGATLEAIVSRMKKMSANVRFIALSATIPNSEDVATWLGKDHTSQHLPAHRETFGEDFRPVKLQKHVHGFDNMMNDFAFEKVLDSKLAGLIQKYTHKKPIIVFCHTRKSCEHTADTLGQWWSRQRTPDRAWPAPKQKINVNNKDLREVLDCGVAFHHAGLDLQDRHAVETGFLGGTISVICCTSTLAVGVNLPCHLVVIKGTLSYQNGRLAEYSDLEVMQMLGRAGRPQFDDNAVAVIMTRNDRVDKYNRMISGQDTLESTLHLNFIELLNSEISLGTVKNVYEAKVWLNGTFLSVRMRQHPTYYSIDGVSAGGSTEERLEQACERDIKLLQDHDLVTSKEQFHCSEYGEAMSRYMVKFETMKLLLSIPPKAKTEQILDIISQAIEFKDMKIKPAERPILREFNKSPFIKFPIKENVTTIAHKVSLMIQIKLGGLEHPSGKDFNTIKHQFLIDTSLILERAQRMMRCIIDCKSFDEDAIATRHALDLARSLAAGFWEYSNLQLRQIKDIGVASIRKLVGSNINSIEKLDEKEPADIDRIMSRNPPFGRKMKDNLTAFPRLEIRSEIVGKALFKRGVKPKITVKAILGYRGTKTPVWNNRKPSLTFMAETSTGKLVYFWRGNMMKLDKGFELKFPVELSNVDEQIKCWISCDELVGTVKTSLLKHDIPASHFPSLNATPPPVELRQPLKDSRTKVAKLADEFGDDEFSDNDLVAAVQSVERDGLDYGSDEFADIDDFEQLKQPKKAESSSKETTDAPRMSNGKYICLHTCGDNQLLKNGKACKHRCCHEGLEKPPNKKKRTGNDAGLDEELNDSQNPVSSRGVGTAQPKKQKPQYRSPLTKFKSESQSNKELEDVESINLANEHSTAPYSSVAPRDYRKLHALHTSVQKDREKSIRLPKQKFQYPYQSSSQQKPAFLQKSRLKKGDFGYGDLSDDEFHPASDLVTTSLKVSNFAGFEYTSGFQPQQPGYSFIHGADDPKAYLFHSEEPQSIDVLARSGSPPLRQSFVEDIFDFDAYQGNDNAANEFGEKFARDDLSAFSSREPTREMEFSSESRNEGDFTRDTSVGQDTDEVKLRRVSQTEQIQESAMTGDLPDLMDEYKDFVEFVD